MTTWTPCGEFTLELPREEVQSFARSQLGSALRRAGISAEFTLASALACWRKCQPAPAHPSLALIWTSRTLTGTENTACLAELLEARELPMPFQFIASQPAMAGVHAKALLPGLDHVATLTHSSHGVEERLLPALARRHAWTHVLLGEVWTPHPWQEGGDRFRAKWWVLGCPAPQDRDGGGGPRRAAWPPA